MIDNATEMKTHLNAPFEAADYDGVYDTIERLCETATAQKWAARNALFSYLPNLVSKCVITPRLGGDGFTWAKFFSDEQGALGGERKWNAFVVEHARLGRDGLGKAVALIENSIERFLQERVAPDTQPGG